MESVWERFHSVGTRTWEEHIHCQWQRPRCRGLQKLWELERYTRIGSLWALRFEFQQHNVWNGNTECEYEKDDGDPDGILGALPHLTGLSVSSQRHYPTESHSHSHIDWKRVKSNNEIKGGHWYQDFDKGDTSEKISTDSDYQMEDTLICRLPLLSDKSTMCIRGRTAPWPPSCCSLQRFSSLFCSGQLSLWCWKIRSTLIEEETQKGRLVSRNWKKTASGAGIVQLTHGLPLEFFALQDPPKPRKAGSSSWKKWKK